MAYSNDEVTGTDGPDELHGFGGDDVLTGLSAGDRLIGGAGDDKAFGNDGSDRLYGGDGDDRLSGGDGYDIMYGGNGNDRYWVDFHRYQTDFVREDPGGGVDEIITSLDYFTLKAWYHEEQEIENLTLTGESDSKLVGNGLDNVLTAGIGDDELDGWTGNDVLHGGPGDDSLFGNWGNDRLLGGLGSDIMGGGSGDDIYTVLEYDDDVLEGNDLGYDTVFAAVSFQLPRHVEKLKLGERARDGAGNTLDNLLIGSDGDNRLRGLVGDDDLRGGRGDDRLLGGLGRDWMTGGLGSDEFAFNDGDTAASRREADVVEDFRQGQGDTLVLAAIDADESSAAHDAFRFIGTAAFSGQAGELHYRIVDGRTFVEGDTDGDRAADFAIRLNGEVALTVSDFSV